VLSQYETFRFYENLSFIAEFMRAKKRGINRRREKTA
jgi:hypothetical protein